MSLFWSEADWEFKGWYGNLQAPIKRVRVGFDTADHILDVAIAPDFTCAWKDEHEFAEAIRIGRFSASDAAEIRAEGDRVIAAVQARQLPFDATLASWRPDPAWEIPAMPLTWNDES